MVLNFSSLWIRNLDKVSLVQNFMEQFDRLFYTAVMSCRIFVQILGLNSRQKILSENQKKMHMRSKKHLKASKSASAKGK